MHRDKLQRLRRWFGISWSVSALAAASTILKVLAQQKDSFANYLVFCIVAPMALVFLVLGLWGYARCGQLLKGIEGNPGGELQRSGWTDGSGWSIVFLGLFFGGVWLIWEMLGWLAPVFWS